MRTTHISVFTALALAASTACTVKDVDAPSLAGPSTFVHSITLVADRDTLTQNGVDSADIRVTSIGPTGQSESIPLRAQILVDGVPQDFGTLSTKTPTTPATIRYTAPPASANPAANIPQSVTIEVTPFNNGDFRAELARQVAIRLTPPGVILPNNPNLLPTFTVSPNNPEAGQVATFDGSQTTNNGVICGLTCTYTWDFGDGSAGAGMQTTHAFRTTGSYAVKLTVTDPRGAQASTTQTVAVALPQPPSGTITISPQPPVGTNVEVFFNASQVQWPGRTIASYDWNFGDGQRGSGVTTTHRYGGVGSYQVILTITDTNGVQATVPASVTVTSQGGAAAALAFTPASPRVNQNVSFDASGSTPSNGAVIVSYKFNYGDGTEEVSAQPAQSHRYNAANTYNVSVEITDSNGKTATKVVSVTVLP
jgi:PKD repeat protein